MLRRFVRLFPPSICGGHDIIPGADVPRTLSRFVIACSSNCVQVQPNRGIRQLEGVGVHVVPLRRDLSRKDEWAPGCRKLSILTPSVTRQTVFSLLRRT